MWLLLLSNIHIHNRTSSTPTYVPYTCMQMCTVQYMCAVGSRRHSDVECYYAYYNWGLSKVEILNYNTVVWFHILQYVRNYISKYSYLEFTYEQSMQYHGHMPVSIFISTMLLPLQGMAHVVVMGHVSVTFPLSPTCRTRGRSVSAHQTLTCVSIQLTSLG